jgi:NTP pyrophosphatase (non-canonical NTP hydrolase)
MDFDDYQQLALKTDKQPLDAHQEAGDEAREIVIPLLGLAGEVGELLSEYKKKLRDRDSYKLFQDRVSEELGDLLWYLANVTSKFGLSLNDVATRNLEKTSSRWAPSSESALSYFDESFPPTEQLPRKAEVSLKLDKSGRVRMTINGKRVGAKLTDNRDQSDGYRFHDVFHLTYMAMLGWSPIIRGLLKCKRRSDLRYDEVEDGGRAAVIEEGIAAMVFSTAEQENFFEGVGGVRYDLLRTIKQMTNHLEVRTRTEGEWERAILRSFEIWRTVNLVGGKMHIDMESRQIQVSEKSTRRRERSGD